MQEELRRLHRTIGGTFIFVTHDQGEAITLSDRIAVMSGGRIQQVGTPREIYERPANRFVAEFMGHSNFYEGTVASLGRDGIGTVTVGDQPFLTQVPPGLAVGGSVFVALRYEKFDVVPARRAGDGQAAVEGTLDEGELMGPFIGVAFDLGPMAPSCRTRRTRGASEHAAWDARARAMGARQRDGSGRLTPAAIIGMRGIR